MGGAAVSTPRTDALCAKLYPPVKCIMEMHALCTVMERELADARTVVADLLANAVPAAAESGDAGMVFVEMTEAEWQRTKDVAARAKAFLVSREGLL
jgi:hypothetical protein